MLAHMIVGHCFADYIFQNDWMSEWKKKNSAVCALHCAIYTATIALSTLFALPWWALVVIFVTHFAQDRTMLVEKFMKFNGQSGFLQYLGPWSKIIVDNVMHLGVLWLLAVIIQGGVR